MPLEMQALKDVKIGFCMCGSFCTFKKSFEQLELLSKNGAIITPIMSFNAYSISTRFGTATENHERLSAFSKGEIIHTIEGAEPLGPKCPLEVMVVSSCTGNTLAKLANSITDTPVTMAVKAHLRGNKPVVICLATNDALAGTAKNLGQLLNYKNYYIVPFSQDDSEKKPLSLVSNFELLLPTVELALMGKQLQPLLATN